MKSVFTILLLLPGFVVAQDNLKKPLTRNEVHSEIKDRSIGAQRLRYGYQSLDNDWTIKNGDTLVMGKGSLPNKDFAFLYEQGGPMTSDFKMIRVYMPSSFTNHNVVVKDIGVSGTKRMGFGVYVVVGIGTLTRYYVELDNAIDAGEITPPARYRKSISSSSDKPVSVADELIKLKQLLDAGAITQQEFDTQKKKLLN